MSMAFLMLIKNIHAMVEMKANWGYLGDALNLQIYLSKSKEKKEIHQY